MYDKSLIERVCNLTCISEDIVRSQTSIKYDIAYPFKKYYDMKTAIRAIKKCISKEWDDTMLSHWFCIYNWIICGGFDDNLKEDLTPIEDFLKEIISWDFDGMAFFDASYIEEDITEYLNDVIQECENLDYIWQTRNEWKLFFSDVGELAKINEDHYALLINDSKKRYTIIHTDYFHYATPAESFKYIAENEFNALVEQLKADEYEIISYSEEFYYDSVND